jgi:hypothetical protein
MVSALHRADVPGDALARVLPRSRFLDLDGVLTGQALVDAFIARYPGADGRLGRWFTDRPIHDGDRTWMLSKMWGAKTQPTLDRLVTLAPTTGFEYEAINAA